MSSQKLLDDRKEGRKAGSISTLNSLLNKVSHIQSAFVEYIKSLRHKHAPLKELFRFVYISLICTILTQSLFIDSALAFEPIKPAITGTSQDLEIIIKKIDGFIPIIKDTNPDIANADQQEFIDKPEITQTKTREELDNEKKKAEAKTSRNVIARDRVTVANTDASIQKAERIGNGYFYGFCTWYVAERRLDIPNSWGNANTWLGRAQQMGWPTGSEPKPGAILVTTESWAGHVAYVESVDADSFTVSEMNLRGWARVSTRTLNLNDHLIRGFIY